MSERILDFEKALCSLTLTSSQRDALEAQAQHAVREERERCAKEIEAASDDECSHVFFWEAANFLRGR